MSDEPELRAGPPWVMEEMILRQPELPAALLPGDGVAGAIAAEAGLCLGVSHDGGTRATRLALDAARAAGARTALVTARPGGEVARAADHVLVTPLRDASWCHTVAYTSALLAGAAIAGDGTDPGALAGLLAAAPDARPLAEALAGSATLAAAGAGVDAVTARELALKVAEGARIPAQGFELETLLHGHLAGLDARSGLVLVALAEGRDPERVARRAGRAARAAAAIGMPVGALLSPAHDRRVDAALTPAGRVVAPADGSALAALLAGALALQRLTLELAHVRGTNPDLIRREEPAYRAAAAAAEAEPW